MADGCFRPVPRNHDGIFGQVEQLSLDGREDLTPIAARKIGTADTVAEERIAGDQLVLARNPETLAARCVARSVDYLKLSRAEISMTGRAGVLTRNQPACTSSISSSS